MDFSVIAKELIRDQTAEWDLAAKNYGSLKKVRVKSFDFNDYRIDIQFNPERIISSSAKVDLKSIQARPCFLCRKNLPPQQRVLHADNDFLVLVNPFPIFPEHLTIPAIVHKDQRIIGNFESMLGLSALLHDFVIFYNGPKCGASAPDHLHFQAGIKGFLPIEKDFYNIKCCRPVRQIRSVTISHWPEYERGIITLTGSLKMDLVHCFSNIYNQLHILQPDEAEPMINILISFEQGVWTVHVFPRLKHRPAQYFEPGEKQILLSPASVDLGGVMITPREVDFKKLLTEDVKDILRQVCFGPQAVMKLINQL
jgi:hypothetical protein